MTLDWQTQGSQHQREPVAWVNADGTSFTEPAAFDAAAQAEALNRIRRREHAIVLSAAFSPDGAYLVAANDAGRVAIWELAPYMRGTSWLPHSTSDDDDGEGDDANNQSLDMTPDLSFQTGGGAINCLRFVTALDGNCLLLCGADTGALAWHWRVLLECVETGECPPEAHVTLRAPQTAGHRGAKLPLPEVNALAVTYCGTEGVVGACGDARAYKWDLRTGGVVRPYAGHAAYLLSAATAPAAQQLLVTGASDGVVGVWDERARPEVAFLHPLSDAAGSSSSAQQGGGGLPAGTAGWVSGVQLGPGGSGWLACAGGYGEGGGGTAAGGFLAMFHLPTQKLTSARALAAPVNAMDLCDDSIITVGDEARVSRWGWCHLGHESSTRVTAKSGFALAVNRSGPYAGVVAAGGRSPEVAICIVPGSVAFSLAFY
ncbi:WD40-repeat-containing domain protein [Tribonema minus]|uniref:WD40-repeat-containing domain protein n=1 Tax=Tribonema minus TaxID=303371 RepID=A0A836CGK1_9STRA|nr:WD40-repeat-containing domain protein [Tribonema minus]